MEGFIYLIESTKNNCLYLGSTNNPARRINEHNRGKNKATKNNIPWKCLAIIKMANLQEARQAEYYIKKYKEKLSVKKVIKILNIFFINTDG